jgi:hypothetical protein
VAHTTEGEGGCVVAEYTTIAVAVDGSAYLGTKRTRTRTETRAGAMVMDLTHSTIDTNCADVTQSHAHGRNWSMSTSTSDSMVCSELRFKPNEKSIALRVLVDKSVVEVRVGYKDIQPMHASVCLLQF